MFVQIGVNNSVGIGGLKQLFGSILLLTLLAVFFGAKYSSAQSTDSHSKTSRNDSLEISGSSSTNFHFASHELTEQTNLTVRGVQLKEYPDWGAVDYAPALEKYPNVLSCFGENSIEERTVDISDFPWMTFQEDEELVVCVTAVAQFLDSPKRMTNWLRSQNMSIDEINLNVPKAGQSIFGTKKHVSEKRKRPILDFVLLLLGLGEPAFYYFAGVAITYTAEGDLFNVKLNPGSK